MLGLTFSLAQERKPYTLHQHHRWFHQSAGTLMHWPAGSYAPWLPKGMSLSLICAHIVSVNSWLWWDHSIITRWLRIPSLATLLDAPTSVLSTSHAFPGWLVAQCLHLTTYSLTLPSLKRYVLWQCCVIPSVNSSSIHSAHCWTVGYRPLQIHIKNDFAADRFGPVCLHTFISGSHILFRERLDSASNCWIVSLLFLLDISVFCK